MKDLNETYFKAFRKHILTIEQKWRNKEITNKEALDFFKEKNNKVDFFLRINPHSPLRMKMISLHSTLRALIQELEEEMKNIYILRTSKDRVIACSDESLVKKCIEHLGKENVKYSKMQVCQTEEDLEGALLEDQMKEQMKNPHIVH